MGKVIENEQNTTKTSSKQRKSKETSQYIDNYINVKMIEFIEKQHKLGKTKETIYLELAKACGVSVSTIRRCKSGYSTFKKYKQLKGFSELTGIPIDELLESIEAKVKLPKEAIQRELPKDLVVNGIDIFSKETYNILCQHTFSNGTLFPAKDNFLIFLDYLIQQEEFILELSEKCKDMLEKFKTSNNISKIRDYNGYDDFKKKISNSKELSKDLRDIITDFKVREMVKELVTRYIYDHLK